MNSALDTNVLVALWNEDESLNKAARSALDNALNKGSLTIAARVYAELLAFRGRDEKFLDLFCRETGIAVDWNLDEGVWRSAGRAFQHYGMRRRRERDGGPRRILADFVIGAHAIHKGLQLLTFDSGLYRMAFPRLTIISV
jgi:hypothetical protein